ncbi:alpha-3-deoxy-D-manno-octulosonic-acid (KDO) transferase (GT30) [Formosa agariphila KMM 3901]|uniref:3-deoxy-D-manno-octulosonic acid transferase n=1 Tax=Formosa agariphila (strain DSM 15362 / KCTC 12365 / LMG 23005 / KMM 3901 / M-2Alg 35-1) TaxID=1347342 RepID=T2KHU7_FORAG|nr:glycosyltransferase N-terminal domain-containing protein [Formosa agariphila]CDF78001.1 alpha-3-deoxy-D-manno-octulosonic-acid (KDO) transferase (GT30) [Formosa agariphila KMM 3901]
MPKKSYFCPKQINLRILYNTGIFLAQYLLQAIGVFNPKIKAGVIGRRETFNKLKKSISATDKTLWFHCASLGEYEQGLPVFSEIKKIYPNHKVILSFFSPSGYDIRKNAPIADCVVYLPLDSKHNAKTLLDLVHPELTVFVKYDIWPNVLNELKRRQGRAILISALFRKEQIFFKPYGGFMKEALFAFEHIFTQNENAKQLLETIGYKAITVSGDTRFDRVSNQLKIDNTLDFIAEFKNNKLCYVAGSTWPEDEKLLVHYINTEAPKDVKFIIAPHNIKANQINQLQSDIKTKTVLFSEKESKDLSQAQVFIIDTIGILTKIYNYADIAYVGGALGTTGLHNTLEPAVFGIPILIGNTYDKFPEAIDMIANQGMFSIKNQSELNEISTKLINNSEFRTKTGAKNAYYINDNEGAIGLITQYLGVNSSK